MTMKTFVEEDRQPSPFCGLGVEIKLKHPDDFLKIRETLTRIGVASFDNRKLIQSAHLLHKRGRYAILMFKELFLIDGKTAAITEEDLARRNTIVRLLVDWGLCELVAPYEKISNQIDSKQIKIVPYSEKKNWELVPKYHFNSER